MLEGIIGTLSGTLSGTLYANSQEKIISPRVENIADEIEPKKPIQPEEEQVLKKVVFS